MIWLIGNKGMLGKQISQELTNGNIPFRETDIEVDITDYQALENFAKTEPFEHIINCSAYTEVDKAEEEYEKAYAINTIGVGNLANIAKANNMKLIHFSTDYVFDGNSSTPYKEDDPTNPLSVYGQSKLDGENFIRQVLDEHYIIRISWLYGVHGSNFVETMLYLFNERNEVSVIDNQIGSPTYAKELAESIVMLLYQIGEFGTYHYSDECEISWFDFASEIYRLAIQHNIQVNNDLKLNAISESSYPTLATRPKYSLFNKAKIQEKLKFKTINWKDNLESYFNLHSFGVD